MVAQELVALAVEPVGRLVLPELPELAVAVVAVDRVRVVQGQIALSGV